MTDTIARYVPEFIPDALTLLAVLDTSEAEAVPVPTLTHVEPDFFVK